MRELAATGDPSVERPLAALAEGNLYVRESRRRRLHRHRGRAGGQARRSADRRRGSARSRRPTSTRSRSTTACAATIRDLLGTLTLWAPTIRRSGSRRRDACSATPTRRDTRLLDAAIAKETIASVKARHGAGARSAVLVVRPARWRKSSRRSSSIAARGGREALSLLTGYAAGSDGALKDAASAAVIAA